MNNVSETLRVQPVPGQQSATMVKAAYRMAQLFVKLFGPYFRTTVLADMIIQAGVEEAEARCRKQDPDTKPTLSKLIMMTGVAYNKVKDILQQPKRIADQHICTEAAVLAYWCKVQRDPTSGKPLELPIFGYTDSFQGIVARVGGRGVSAQSMLDRLTAAGNIEVCNKHFVRITDPNWRLFEDNEDELLDYGAQSIASLATAVAHNLENKDSDHNKWVERRVYSHKIPANQFGQVRREMNTLLKRQYKELVEFIRTKECKTKTESSLLLGAGYYLWES